MEKELFERWNELLRMKASTYEHPARKAGERVSEPSIDDICKQCQAVRSKKKNTYTKKKKYYDRAKLDPKMMEKYKARDAVQRAIKSGLIQRTACTAQGCDVIEGTQAHHWLGYSKENWLKVLWLCSKHHADSHHNTL